MIPFFRSYVTIRKTKHVTQIDPDFYDASIDILFCLRERERERERERFKIQDSKTYIADHSQFKAHEDHRQHLGIQHGSLFKSFLSGSIGSRLSLPIIVNYNLNIIVIVVVLNGPWPLGLISPSYPPLRYSFLFCSSFLLFLPPPTPFPSLPPPSLAMALQNSQGALTSTILF